MGPSGICLVALLSLLIPAYSAPDPTLDTHWQLWIKTHQKTYKDATGEEVAATMTGFTGSRDSLANMTEVPKEILEAQTPASIDWRTQGCVTSVKNQGSCGSCYAFGTVGSLECQWKKKMGTLVSFSPQELVDCSYTEGNNGCKGGYLQASFRYMKKYGVMEESSYPYTAKEGRCKKDKPSNVGVVKTFYVVPAGKELLLMKVLGTVGPVSVAIDCSREGFRMYKSGVYYDPYCTTKVDHAVLVVGYGTDNGKDYWLVKNSWGVGYGDKGYIKMARNRGNNCAIASHAVYPTV